MTKQDVTISCPHCLREYSLALDLEKLTRIRKQAVCARCKQSFDVGSRVVVRESAPRTRTARRSAPAIAAIRPHDPTRRRGAVAREEVLSPRRGHEDFSAARPGAVSSAPPAAIARWSPMSKPSPAPPVDPHATGVDRWRPARPPAQEARVSAVARAAFERAAAEREITESQTGTAASVQATARPPRAARGATTPPARPVAPRETAPDEIGLARTLPIPKGDWLARADIGLGALSRESNATLDALESLLAGGP